MIKLAGPVSMARFADAIQRHYDDMGCSPKTKCKVRFVLSALVNQAGVTTTEELNDDALKRFEESFHQANPVTRFSHLRALHSLCGHAVKLGLLRSMPKFPAIPQVGEMKNIRDFCSEPLPEQDHRRLLEYLVTKVDTWEGRRLYVLVVTILATGLLRDDALNLRCEDVDLATSMIKIRRRARMKRSALPSSVPIKDFLKGILSLWLSETGSEWLFPGKLRLGPWSGKDHDKPINYLKEMSCSAGISNMTFERLRISSEGIEILDLPGKLDPLNPQALKYQKTIRTYRPRRLSVDDVTQLMARLLENSATWEGHRLYALAGLALFTGLRRGQLLNLRIENINIHSSIISVHNIYIPVVLSPEAKEILGRWLGRSDRGKSPFVFPGVLERGPWFGGTKKSKLHSQMRIAAEAAGIGRVSLDDLSRFSRLNHGRINLGETWRAMKGPDLCLTGPQPGRSGPLPKKPRPKTKSIPPIVPIFSDWGADDSPAVEIQMPEGRVFIRGKDKGVLTPACLEVVLVLLAAWPEGLSLKEFGAKCKRSGWRQLLTNLIKDQDWASAISFPGTGFPGKNSNFYRIKPW
jgi:integrase